MGKHILLIGVSAGKLAVEHAEQSLAIANVTALKKTLLTEVKDLRDDHVTLLINPDLKQMRHAITQMTYRCRHGDLCLIYYTGCGVIDAHTGTFYLPADDTELDAIATTALSSDYIRQALPSAQAGLSRVMILDCLWGALPLQHPAENSEMLLPQGIPDRHALPQLADCKCALLTALSSSACPWPVTETGLSVYTQHLIDGITTGLADTDADGSISIKDLQTYLDKALRETDCDLVSMVLHIPQDSTQVPLLPVMPYSAEREYRRSVEEYAHRHRGHIPPANRNVLDFLRHQLGITWEESQMIEAEVMTPYAEHQENCDRYRQALITALDLENPLGTPLKKWLRHLQGKLGLSYEDISIIEAQLLTHSEPYSHLPSHHLKTLPQWLPPAGIPKLPAHTPHQNGHQNGYSEQSLR